jgi:hypothetical protein
VNICVISLIAFAEFTRIYELVLSITIELPQFDMKEVVVVGGKGIVVVKGPVVVKKGSIARHEFIDIFTFPILITFSEYKIIEILSTLLF